jgi:hypothetical protein
VCPNEATNRHQRREKEFRKIFYFTFFFLKKVFFYSGGGAGRRTTTGILPVSGKKMNTLKVFLRVKRERRENGE